MSTYCCSCQTFIGYFDIDTIKGYNCCDKCFKNGAYAAKLAKIYRFVYQEENEKALKELEMKKLEAIKNETAFEQEKKALKEKLGRKEDAFRMELSEVDKLLVSKNLYIYANEFIEFATSIRQHKLDVTDLSLRSKSA